MLKPDFKLLKIGDEFQLFPAAKQTWVKTSDCGFRQLGGSPLEHNSAPILSNTLYRQGLPAVWTAKSVTELLAEYATKPKETIEAIYHSRPHIAALFLTEGIKRKQFNLAACNTIVSFLSDLFVAERDALLVAASEESKNADEG